MFYLRANLFETKVMVFAVLMILWSKNLICLAEAIDCKMNTFVVTPVVASVALRLFHVTVCNELCRICFCKSDGVARQTYNIAFFVFADCCEGHTSLLNSWKVYAFLELFAGKANVTKCIRYAGHPAGKMDISYNKPKIGKQNHMDILTPAGFAFRPQHRPSAC